ncbi:MAG: alpha/beta fold hydrolase [Alphaproteobacteria bacterium]
MTTALPIVFIPGASSDETTWADQQRHFDGRTQVIVAGLTQFDTIDAMSDQVLKLAPPEFLLCGTSMGGYVALDVLKKAQARVKKVALCNTTARADTPERRSQRQAEINLGEEAYLKARQDDNHYSAFLSEASLRNRALIARLREISTRVGYGCFKRHQNACATRSDSLAFLESIDIPVLVVGGAEDKLIPSALQEEIHQKIGQSRLRIISGAGHITQMEKPDEMTSVLAEFFFAGEGRAA